MKIALSVSACLILACSAFAQSNTLANLANSMQPGTFALLNQEGDGSGWGAALLHSGSGIGGITGFASKGVYDATTDRIYFSGGEHDGITKTIHYTASSNTWFSDATVPSPQFQWGHAYDSNAIIPGDRGLYANSTLLKNVRRFDITTGTYTAPAQPPDFYATEPSMEWFPERNELLWLQGGRLGGLAKYTRSTNSWATVTTSLSALEVRGAIARYIPSQHAVLLLGGVNTDPMEQNPPMPAVPSHAVYKYDQNGAITRLNDFPSSIWMYPSHAVAVVDPVSGDLIVLNAVVNGNLNAFTGNIEFWKHSATTDAWSQMNSSIVPNTSGWMIAPGNLFGVITITLPSPYNVTMFAADAFGVQGASPKVYLYKHSTSSSSGGPTFAQKIAAPGVIAAYGFDSATNIRNFPVAANYPMKYGGWNQTGPCQTLATQYGITEYTYTQSRLSNEANALVAVQNGACYLPYIDGGALRIEIPSKSDAQAGGKFETPFKGLDLPFAIVVPELHFQYKFKTSIPDPNFGDTGANTFAKMHILCPTPPGGDYCGSDVNLGNVSIFGWGFGANRNGLIQNYNYDAAGVLINTERNINGTLYLQNSVLCAYNGAGPYSYPPCVGLKNNQWQEFTFDLKLNPVGSNFVGHNESGAHALYRSTAWTSSTAVGRKVSVVNLATNPATVVQTTITAVYDANTVLVNATVPEASNLVVYVSSYPNSSLDVSVDGVKIISVNDQPMAWDQALGWGMLRLQPHMTSKNPAIVHAPATVWYDELIFSTQPIAMTTGGQQQSPTPPPTEPPPCKGNGKKCN